MATTIKQFVKGSPITVRQDDTLALALHVMIWGDVRHLPVVNGDRLVGVLSERDILRRYSDVGHFMASREKVTVAMSSLPVTIGPDDDLDRAIDLVATHGVGCLPVVERDCLVGIVTRRDLLARQAERAEEEVPGGAGQTQEQSPGWAGLRVDDVMSREPVTAFRDDVIRTVIERMGRHGIRHLPVVDGERRVIGVVSDRDVRTAIGDPLRAVNARDAFVRLETTRVADAMTPSPSTLPSGTRLSQAAAFFADHKVGALPIVDQDERLVGLISYTDILRAVIGSKSNAS